MPRFNPEFTSDISGNTRFLKAVGEELLLESRQDSSAFSASTTSLPSDINRYTDRSSGKLITHIVCSSVADAEKAYEVVNKNLGVFGQKK